MQSIELTKSVKFFSFSLMYFGWINFKKYFHFAFLAETVTEFHDATRELHEWK